MRNFINSRYEGFVHDTPMWLGGCDCTHKRRVDHRKLINGVMLAVETAVGDLSARSAALHGRRAIVALRRAAARARQPRHARQLLHLRPTAQRLHDRVVVVIIALRRRGPAASTQRIVRTASQPRHAAATALLHDCLMLCQDAELPRRR